LAAATAAEAEALRFTAQPSKGLERVRRARKWLGVDADPRLRVEIDRIEAGLLFELGRAEDAAALANEALLIVRGPQVRALSSALYLEVAGFLAQVDEMRALDASALAVIHGPKHDARFRATARLVYAWRLCEVGNSDLAALTIGLLEEQDPGALDEVSRLHALWLRGRIDFDR